MTIGIKLLSMQLSKIFCRPRNVSAWSSQTSEKKKKFISEKSRWIRTENCVLIIFLSGGEGYLCEWGGERGSCKHLHPLGALSLLYLESRHAQISS